MWSFTNVVYSVLYNIIDFYVPMATMWWQSLKGENHFEAVVSSLYERAS